MIFGKKNRLVGLDIGSRTLKAAEVAETKKGRSLKKFGTIDIPLGTIEDGIIKDTAVIADSIRQLFKAYNLREKNVAISIGGFSVIVKKIAVQNMSEEQLQETIHFEAEQYIPFDISDVNLDFQILGENESNPNQMDVLLVAARREMIDEYVNVIQLAGLNTCVIDIDAFALQNIFEINHGTEEEIVALIDIGAGKTSLNILKDNSSIFMRDVSLGCGQINQKIASFVDCSLEVAEQIKQGELTDKLPQEKLNEVILSVVSDWCSEIKRALDFFYSTFTEDRIKKIFISGGGANISQLSRLLASETSCEVEIINPFENLYIDDDLFDSAYLKRIGPQAVICMGLALRRIDDK